MKKGLKNLGFWLLFLIIALILFQIFSTHEGSMKEPIPYSSFLSLLEKGKVAEVKIVQEGGIYKVDGKLYEGGQFSTYAPSDSDLIKLLKEKGVLISVRPNSGHPFWVSFLINALPFLLIVGIWILLLRQWQGAGNRAISFGKSRPRVYGVGSGNRPNVTFNDVAGCDEAKEELKEVIEFLKDPRKFHRLGARIPRGILLVGRPGTGKTLLAKAVSGEAGVPFFSISGSDFVEMFVGVGAARVRDLFEQAKKHAPCILFIDELDAVGRHRGAGLGGGHDEREQTLNELLVQMDGFGTTDTVIVMAATNRPDILDPALLRPGRFDRHVVVDVPDIKGREEILKVHMRGKPIAPDVDIKTLARRTPGFVGADLANLVNEAALLAARKGKKEIGMEELEAAIDRVIAGPERKSRVITEREKEIIAYHEAGHGLVGALLPGSTRIHKLTIVPRGIHALGITIRLPVEDKYLATKSEMMNDITYALGGRAAEEIVFNEVTTGSQNDLERVTEIAHKMVCEYGMSEKLGPVTLGRKEEQVFLGKDILKERNYSERIQYEIDKEVRNIVERCYENAKRIIMENKDKLDRIVKELLEKEVLTGEDVARIIREESLTYA